MAVANVVDMPPQAEPQGDPVMPSEISTVTQMTIEATNATSVAAMPLGTTQPNGNIVVGPHAVASRPNDPQVRAQVIVPDPAQAICRNDSDPIEPSKRGPDSGTANAQNSVDTVINSQPSQSTCKPPVTMATQTEWDLWGSPISAGRSFVTPTKQIPPCSCEYNVRLLLDWKREIEKLIAYNSDQEKARSNYLRGRLSNADDDREKMKGTTSTLSKQIATNATMISELSGRGPGSGDCDYGSRVFACGTGNASPRTSSATPHHLRDDVRYFPSSKKPPTVSNAASSTPTNASGAVQSSTPAGPGNGAIGGNQGNTAPQHAALPQRARGKADRSSDTRGPGPTRSGPQAPDPKLTSTNQTVNNLPGRNINGNNYPRPPNGQVAVSDNLPPNGNQRDVSAKASYDNTQVPSTSWADDQLSDAELICVTDESVCLPSSSQICPPHGTSVGASKPPQSSAPSGSRGNYNMSTPQPDQAVDMSRKGEKRGNDGHLERPGNNQSYAQATTKYPWNTVENKRTKRNRAEDGSLVLLGAKATSHKEIFVKHLDYSRCSKPADLESRVKLFCRRKGVFIVQVRVFEQSDCNRANVRVSLKEDDVDTAMCPGFWPQHASVRFWSQNPQNDPANPNEYGDGDDIL